MPVCTAVMFIFAVHRNSLAYAGILQSCSTSGLQRVVYELLNHFGLELASRPYRYKFAKPENTFARKVFQFCSVATMNRPLTSPPGCITAERSARCAGSYD